MCVYKTEVRPGINGIIDHIDVINDVRYKVTCLLNLLAAKEATQDDDDEAGIVATLVRDMLEHAWSAFEGIYAIYRNEVANDKQAVGE